MKKSRTRKQRQSYKTQYPIELYISKKNPEMFLTYRIADMEVNGIKYGRKVLTEIDSSRNELQKKTYNKLKRKWEKEFNMIKSGDE